VSVTVRRISLLLLLLSLTACQSVAAITASIPTAAPPTADPAARPTLPAPAPAFPFADGWTAAETGIELRRLAGPPDGSPVGVLAVRVDPTAVSFRMVYDQQRPRAISAWAADYGAAIAVNAGYFDDVGRPVALLVSDGVAVGDTYLDQGGMFAVTADGRLLLTALSDEPYNGEPLQQALQGWPLLVRAPGVAAYAVEDGRRSRRTAVGLDQAGRVILLVSPAADFSLAEWSQYLAAADLQLVRAVNLDGGSSTGIALRNANAATAVEAFAALPFALLITPR
jgi:uncharacterized protein YigE (DUF2233 family)